MPTRAPLSPLLLIAAMLMPLTGQGADRDMGPPDPQLYEDPDRQRSNTPDTPPPQETDAGDEPAPPSPLTDEPLTNEPLPSPGTAIGLDDPATAGRYDPVAAMNRFEDLMDDGQYRAATDVAEAMLARTELRYGADTDRLIAPLRALASAQVANDAPRDAEATLVRLVELIESQDGIFDDSLVEPLIALGNAHKMQGELDDSLSAYIRARYVTHRNYGVVNGEQLPIIDLMTELHIAMGELTDANREQRLAYRIADTNCGDDDVCRVDGMYKLARWYQRLSRFTQARGLYRDALEILEEEYGANHTGLVPALHGVAQTYEQQGQRFGEGRRSLERAAAILDAQAFADVTEHVDAHRKLGDWYNLTNDHERARAAYARAWDVIAADDESATEAKAVFALPEALRYRPPEPIIGDPAWHESRLDGSYVVVEFDVNEFGRVENARVIEANTSARVRKEVRDAVRRAKYRPKLEDGVPVRSEGIKLTQGFEYVNIYRQRKKMRDAANRKGVNACAGSGCGTSGLPPGVPIEVRGMGTTPRAMDKPDPLLDGASVTEEVP